MSTAIYNRDLPYVQKKVLIFTTLFITCNDGTNSSERKLELNASLGNQQTHTVEDIKEDESIETEKEECLVYFNH